MKLGDDTTQRQYWESLAHKEPNGKKLLERPDQAYKRLSSQQGAYPTQYSGANTRYVNSFIHKDDRYLLSVLFETADPLLLGPIFNMLKRIKHDEIK